MVKFLAMARFQARIKALATLRWVIVSLLLWPGLPAVAQDSLHVIVAPAQPIAGEMIPVTIRGEYTGFIAGENMTFPDSSGYDWIQLGPDEWSDARVDGKARRIFQRHIAVFPRKPGSLSIGPVTHHLTKSQGSTRLPAEITANPVTVTVLPFPAPGRPLVARSLKVTDELSDDPARIRDDQTILRRITLTAVGSMAHLLPARPILREPWLISFAAPEIRETRLTEQGPVAFVQWEWNLRPITGEQGTLPPMRFSWFDTNKRELRGEITPPVPFGYGKVGENIGGAARLARHSIWMAMSGLAAGGIIALAVMLRGRGIAMQGAGRIWRGLCPNPALPALRHAAQSNDLFALRRAAQDYLDAEIRVGRPPRNPTSLSRLDAALYRQGASNDFDPASFVQDLTRR